MIARPLEKQATNTAEQWSNSDERFRKFGQAIDAIRQRIDQDLGEKDLQYILKIRRLSKRMEITGRLFTHFSFEPLGFTTGVLAQWVHKQLEVAEIGHMALHGAYDKLNPPKDLQSKNFRWIFPVDEASWCIGHNARHHPYTNIAGKDPDIHFGFVRLTPETPHRFVHYLQVPTVLLFILPNFGSAINTHVTGLLDVYIGNGIDSEMDFLKDRTWTSILAAHRQAFRKWVPYYAKNFVFYPALAGPFFGKVLLGNWLADKMRDIYTGTTIFCGHVGKDVKSYEDSAKAVNRGQWYAMQVEAAHNFQVSLPFSILCGALNLQIEHHLFPRLPPNRLREVSEEVKACCEQFGIEYKTDSWTGTLRKVFRQLVELSQPAKSQPV